MAVQQLPKPSPGRRRWRLRGNPVYDPSRCHKPNAGFWAGATEILTDDKHGQSRSVLDVRAAADYIGRSPSALRHLIAKGAIPCVRRDGRVQLDRQDLDNWVELSKTGV